MSTSTATKVKISMPTGAAGGSIVLPPELFDVEPNIPLMHQVVTAQLAAARAGTHSVKTRGQVRGGGRKPYRQKGTGRARQGSVRAPQFAGGGVVHGPTPRDYSQRTPKKMKVAALRGALSDRARAGRVHVLSRVLEDDEPSTKAARQAVAAVSDAPHVLVVIGRDDEFGWLSLRNLPNVHLVAPDQLNTYDVLVNDDVVFIRSALDEFITWTSGGELTATVDESDTADTARPTRARKAESAKTESAKTESAKTESTKAGAGKATASKAESAKTESTKAVSTTAGSSKSGASTKPAAARTSGKPDGAAPKDAVSKAAAAKTAGASSSAKRAPAKGGTSKAAKSDSAASKPAGRGKSSGKEKA